MSNRAPEFPTIEKKNDQRQQPSGFSFAEKDIYFVVGETKNTSKWGGRILSKKYRASLESIMPCIKIELLESGGVSKSPYIV